MKETEAARAVLLEVLNALGAMRDELVIVGGWVPNLLYPTSNHMGSLNVDLAVSPKAIGGNAYSSIRERLTKIGYTMHESPTRFFKHLPGLANLIKIDLITGLNVSQQKQDSILVEEIRPNAGTFLASAIAYPAWSQREGCVITLEDRVLNCFMRSCNGTRPPVVNSYPRSHFKLREHLPPALRRGEYNWEIK